MLEKTKCIHPVQGFRWDDPSAKKSEWVRCSMCGETCPFNWLLAADIPTNLGKRMALLCMVLAPGRPEFAPTKPVEASDGFDAMLGPEVTIERNAHLLRTNQTYAYAGDGND